MERQLVFLRFDATTTSDRIVRLDQVTTRVRHIDVRAISFERTSFPPAVSLRIDGVNHNCVTEGAQGFPIPSITSAQGAAANGGGGWYFNPPLRLGSPNNAAMKDLHCQLRTPNNGTLTLAGTEECCIWLELVCEPPTTNYEDQRLRAFISPFGPEVGANSWRWDYVPTAEEAAQHMQQLESRFSNQIEQ